jgi:hypothetical protein
MGFSKNSENQTNKGGLLRQGNPIERIRAGDTAGPSASKQRTRKDRTETRINKRSGGKRRARKKRSGKTTGSLPKRKSRKSNLNICPIIPVNSSLIGNDASSQWLTGSITKSGAK